MISGNSRVARHVENLILAAYDRISVPPKFSDKDIYFYTMDGDSITVAMSLNCHEGFFYNLFDDLTSQYEGKIGYVSKMASIGNASRKEIKCCATEMARYGKHIGLSKILAAVTPTHARAYEKLGLTKTLSEIRILEEFNKELILIEVVMDED